MRLEGHQHPAPRSGCRKVSGLWRFNPLAAWRDNSPEHIGSLAYPAARTVSDLQERQAPVITCLPLDLDQQFRIITDMVGQKLQKNLTSTTYADKYTVAILDLTSRSGETGFADIGRSLRGLDVIRGPVAMYAVTRSIIELCIVHIDIG